MAVSSLLLGIILLLAGLNWANVTTISWVLIGFLAIVDGIIYIVNSLGVATDIPVRRVRD